MTTTREEHLHITHGLILRDHTTVIGFQNDLGETTVYGADRLQELLTGSEAQGAAKTVFPTRSSTPEPDEGKLGEVRFQPVTGRLYVRLENDWAFLALAPASPC